MNPGINSVLDSNDKQVSPILSPLEKNGVGDDPKYSESFVYIKNELDKLSDTDYAGIARACEDILSKESKDLRVAGYLVLAKTYTDGVDGLTEATEIYLSLLEKYGASLHPQRESARIQAFSWLNNQKLVVFLEEYLSNNDETLEKISYIQSVIDKINQVATDCIGQGVSGWSILNNLFSKKIIKLSERERQQTSSVEEKKSKDIHINKTISNESEFSKSSAELIGYMQKSDDWMRAIAVSRALRWTSLVIPPNVDGSTKLPAPRDVVIAQVSGSAQINDYKQQISNYEQFFLEQGGQYWLDLQFKAVQAARKLDWNDVADLIEDLTSRLITMRPQLKRLTFDTGMPFASVKTRRWLSDIVSDNNRQTIKQIEKDSDSIIAQLETIRSEPDANGVSGTLKKISELSVRSECEKFYVDLARIDVCIDNDRPDIALRIAEVLDKKVSKFNLAEWEPSLAVQVWGRMRDLLLQVKPGNDVTKRIDILEEKMCELDVIAVLNLA